MPVPSNPNGVPSWSTNGMTSAGRVAAGGLFGGAIVRQVARGSSPQVIFTHGRAPGGAEIGRCNLTLNATYYPASSVPVPDGVYMTVTGSPRRFQVEAYVG